MESISQRGHLPVQANTLIGRDHDLELASTVLVDPACRLLTLIGSGGIGKTRLAVAVAEAVGNRFADGLCFVDLTFVADPAAVPSLIAAGLDLRVESHSALEGLKGYLSSRQQLLVLDNFEHVLSGGLAVAEILDFCPDIKVLATSREPLRLRWEQRMAVGELELPDLDHLPDRDELVEIPAVSLFLERARAVDLRFEASDDTLRQIAEICVRLDGVPLAIELAAARIRSIPPASMLKRFDRALLRQDAPDVPSRHRSVDATLNWSYHSLSPLEQSVFRHLGLFVGGCSLEAVEAVMSGAGESSALLEALSSLTDKALILADPSATGEPRFRQFDTTRFYAAEQLRKAGEIEAARAGHARYYLAFTERESAGLRQSGNLVFVASRSPSGSLRAARPHWPAVLDHDFANIDTALRWAYERGEHEILLRFAVALGRYWWLRRLLREGTHWLELALQRNPHAEAGLRSRALGSLGVMYRQQGDFERSRQVLEEAVRVTQTLDDPELLAAQLIDLGNTLGSLNRIPEGMLLLEESARLSRAGDDSWGVAAALTFLAAGEIITDHPESAEARLAEGLTLFQKVGDVRAVAVVNAVISRAVSMQDDTERALAYLVDALELCRQLGPDVWLAPIIEIAACVLSKVRAPAQCARLLGAGEGQRVRGQKRVIFEATIYDACLADLRAALDARTLASALQEGRQISAGDAINEALALVGQQSPPGEPSAERKRPVNAMLSVRELEVVRLLAEGCGNKEIGRRLAISDNTAKFHVTSILKKLEVENRVEAVTAAIRRGLL